MCEWANLSKLWQLSMAPRSGQNIKSPPRLYWVWNTIHLTIILVLFLTRTLTWTYWRTNYNNNSRNYNNNNNNNNCKNYTNNYNWEQVCLSRDGHRLHGQWHFCHPECSQLGGLRWGADIIWTKESYFLFSCILPSNPGLPVLDTGRNGTRRRVSTPVYP